MFIKKERGHCLKLNDRLYTPCLDNNVKIHETESDVTKHNAC